jgi:hypothetical protein
LLQENSRAADFQACFSLARRDNPPMNHPLKLILPNSTPAQRIFRIFIPAATSDRRNFICDVIGGLRRFSGAYGPHRFNLTGFADPSEVSGGFTAVFLPLTSHRMGVLAHD